MDPWCKRPSGDWQTGAVDVCLVQTIVPVDEEKYNSPKEEVNYVLSKSLIDVGKKIAIRSGTNLSAGCEERNMHFPMSMWKKKGERKVLVIEHSMRRAMLKK